MGVLHYMDYRLDFDDRTLLHLQIVIAQKIRRQEAFFFSWIVPSREGGGRRSIWIDNSIPLGFSFQATPANSINPAWMEALALTSNQGTGLHLLAEPALPVTRTASPMPRLATPAH